MCVCVCVCVCVLKSTNVTMILKSFCLNHNMTCKYGLSSALFPAVAGELGAGRSAPVGRAATCRSLDYLSNVRAFVSGVKFVSFCLPPQNTTACAEGPPSGRAMA